MSFPMKVTFIVKKSVKRYDTDSKATIYLRLRDGRQFDSIAPTKLSINPNLIDCLSGYVERSKSFADIELSVMKINRKL
ncbi:hypothetical protein LJB92_03805 [Bacteroidales bacterium OttesenSCG-928-M06]|nr:hypothetical protein [Bacteroidales bacterium OttesenSCG-928-M06]